MNQVSRFSGKASCDRVVLPSLLIFKQDLKQKGITGSINRNGLGGGGGGEGRRGEDTQQFFTRFLILFVKHRRLKVAKRRRKGGAMLCLLVSISDVMNKPGMHGESIKHVTSQTFSALHW